MIHFPASWTKLQGLTGNYRDEAQNKQNIWTGLKVYLRFVSYNLSDDPLKRLKRGLNMPGSDSSLFYVPAPGGASYHSLADHNKMRLEKSTLEAAVLSEILLVLQNNGGDFPQKPAPGQAKLLVVSFGSGPFPAEVIALNKVFGAAGFEYFGLDNNEGMARHHANAPKPFSEKHIHLLTLDASDPECVKKALGNRKADIVLFRQPNFSLEDMPFVRMFQQTLPAIAKKDAALFVSTYREREMGVVLRLLCRSLLPKERTIEPYSDQLAPGVVYGKEELVAEQHMRFIPHYNPETHCEAIKHAESFLNKCGFFAKVVVGATAAALVAYGLS
jgi:hypothetical protein